MRKIDSFYVKRFTFALSNVILLSRQKIKSYQLLQFLDLSTIMNLPLRICDNSNILNGYNFIGFTAKEQRSIIISSYDDLLSAFI